jgi:glutaredoxin-like protein
MTLIAAADQERLRVAFLVMTRKVRVLFFTQTFGCETCGQVRQIVNELPQLSDKIAIEEINFVLESTRAADYGIDRAPAMALAYEARDGTLVDTRMRFIGAPHGYEFISLVEAIVLAGGGTPRLTPASQSRLAVVDQPMTIKVFVTPSCPHCPRAVTLAQEMAFANPHIVSYAIEANEFPDLAEHYQVSGVPKTIVNDDIEILGALPEDALIERALGLQSNE